MEIFSKELLTLPYRPDEVLAEYTSATTTTLDIIGDGVYEIIAVSGGAGGMTYDTGGAYWYNIKGGTGAYYDGKIRIARGTYTITIGSGGNGGNYNAQIGGTVAGAGGATSLSGVITLSGATSYTTSGSGGSLSSIANEVSRINYSAGYGTNSEGAPEYPYYRDDQLGPSNNYGLGAYGKGGGPQYGGGRSGTGGYLKIIYKGAY